MKTRRRTRLSPHFKLSEFRDRSTGALPPAAADAALVKLCQNVLEPLRTRYGTCHVFSGYRTHAHNAEVGGARHSHHLYDEWPSSPAADVGFAAGSPSDWARDAERLMPRGGLSAYPGHLHVDLRPDRARW